jgi:hypothetical protein
LFLSTADKVKKQEYKSRGGKMHCLIVQAIRSNKPGETASFAGKQQP